MPTKKENIRLYKQKWSMELMEWLCPTPSEAVAEAEKDENDLVTYTRPRTSAQKKRPWQSDCFYG